MAEAHAAENRAQHNTLTPLAVMDHAYEALGKLGGTGTMIMLGDWSHVPQFLRLTSRLTHWPLHTLRPAGQTQFPETQMSPGMQA